MKFRALFLVIFLIIYCLNGLADGDLYADANHEYVNDNNQKALSIINEYIEINGNDYRGQYLKGRILIELDDYGSAIFSLKNAQSFAKSKKEKADALYQEGIAHRGLDNKDKARDCCSKAARLSEGDYDANLCDIQIGHEWQPGGHLPIKYADAEAIQLGSAYAKELKSFDMNFDSEFAASAESSVPSEVSKFAIEGIVFDDADGNSVRDHNETGLANWTVDLEQPVGTVIANTTTAADGNFTFTDLVSGEYAVVEVLKTGWNLTSPADGKFVISVTNANITDLEFANKMLQEKGLTSHNISRAEKEIMLTNITLRPEVTSNSSSKSPEFQNGTLNMRRIAYDLKTKSAVFL
jgi:tetratricopeptide (TPR) repeat protein